MIRGPTWAETHAHMTEYNKQRRMADTIPDSRERGMPWMRGTDSGTAGEADEACLMRWQIQSSIDMDEGTLCLLSGNPGRVFSCSAMDQTRRANRDGGCGRGQLAV